MQEVTTVAEGTNPKGAECAAGEIPPAAESRALLGGIVDEQAAAAVVAVASGVVAATQLSLVLGVAEGNMKLMEAVGELTALSILAETSC